MRSRGSRRQVTAQLVWILVARLPEPAARADAPGSTISWPSRSGLPPSSCSTGTGAEGWLVVSSLALSGERFRSAAPPQLGELGIRGGGPPDHVVDRGPAFEDQAAMSGQQPTAPGAGRSRGAAPRPMPGRGRARQPRRRRSPRRAPRPWAVRHGLGSSRSSGTERPGCRRATTLEVVAKAPR